MDEALIRQCVEDWAKALRARDIDGVMSLYASNIVSFDLDPPLRFAGTDNKRRAWQRFFATHTGPLTYDVHDIHVTTQSALAFVHSLNHVCGTLASGHTSELWVRWTACFQRINGVWLVVHEHVSVPADVEHGRAVLNLTPLSPSEAQETVPYTISGAWRSTILAYPGLQRINQPTVSK